MIVGCYRMFHKIDKTLEICSRSSNFLACLGRLQSLESQSDGGPARSESELSGAWTRSKDGAAADPASMMSELASH